MYRCMTIEEYRERMAKAEREVEKGHKDLKNAERRVRINYSAFSLIRPLILTRLTIL